jgi:hypothetical protein
MVLIVLVFVAGMFVTLFENDSAQFAVMAMRMVQENDFLNLFKGPQEYLDKPHMHYWLAAFSYKIFGLHDWAYRIPGILAGLLAAYSCYGLGSLLYNCSVGKLAALVFLTSQTIVLAQIDVRTDSVLTGFTAFAIWQLVAYIQRGHWYHIVLGALGAGLAFSTKGQIALLVMGFPILFYLWYTKKWHRLFHWKSILALLVFGLAISPMLYAYYHQFDLHPEKVIRGRDHRSGIFFIFWEQSFERLSGQGMGKNSSDYFFFFHTFLWVFLPWTIMGVLGLFSGWKKCIAYQGKFNPGYEWLTLGGIAAIFLVISFAQFKLPHYLNITIPLFAVLTAAYVYHLYIDSRELFLKRLLGVQYGILGVVFIATVLFCFLVFRAESIWVLLWLGVLIALAVFFILRREGAYHKIITLTVLTSVILNFTMNLVFYPALLKYQAGSTMAEKVAEKQIPVDKIYKLDGGSHTWGLDFYNKKPVKITDIKKVVSLHDVWVYATDVELQAMKKAGMDWDEQITVDQFRITRLDANFLRPSTRNSVLNKRHLVHIY